MCFDHCRFACGPLKSHFRLADGLSAYGFGFILFGTRIVAVNAFNLGQVTRCIFRIEPIDIAHTVAIMMLRVCWGG